MNPDFKDAPTLAYAVKDAADVELVPHPYDRFRPTETIWWLVPSKDQGPWYKYGKLFFTSRPEDLGPMGADTIYCGFYVEKGVSPSISSAYRRHPHWVMGTDWVWHEFISVPSSELPPPPEGDIILVSTGQIDDEQPRHDPRDVWTPTRIWFQAGSNGAIHSIADRPNDNQPEVVDYVRQNIKTARTLTELASAFTRLPQLFHWAWVDLCIGTAVSKGSDEPDAAKLWREHMLPWRRLLRAR